MKRLGCKGGGWWGQGVGLWQRCDLSANGLQSEEQEQDESVSWGCHDHGSQGFNGNLGAGRGHMDCNSAPVLHINVLDAEEVMLQEMANCGVDCWAACQVHPEAASLFRFTSLAWGVMAQPGKSIQAADIKSPRKCHRILPPVHSVVPSCREVDLGYKADAEGLIWCS
jgi:hypothetical protein